MKRRTPSGDVLTDVILEVFRVNGDLISEGDRIAGAFGQSSARWQVLGAIADDARTVPEIGRAMGLTRQAVQRTADILEGDGLLEYRDNPAHRRSKLVAMTARGRRVYDAITEKQLVWANRLAADMDVGIQDIRKTVRVLKSLGTALESTIDANGAR